MRRPGYCHLLSTSFLFVVLLLQPYHVNASWVSNLLQSVGRLFDHRGPRSLDEPVEDSAGNAPGTVGIMWGMPDTEAAVGKLFRFPVPENAFSGNIDQYRIENVGDNTLPSWLYFNQTSKILYGVPSYADQGNIMLQVTAFGRRHNNSAHVSNATAAFLVRVHAGSHNSWFNDIDIETQTSDKKDHKSSLPDCNWDENIIHATLILDADMTSLKSLNRVKILYKAAHFLQRPVLSITLTPKKNSVIAKLLDTSVLIAGPGNAPIKTKNPGVEVSWIIACGDFQNTDDISHIMSHNIQSGRITQELGHHIIGWHVTQTLPPENIRKLRIKRQAGRRKTAIPTPTLHPTATITRPSTRTSTSTSSSSSSKSSEIKPTRTVSSSETLTISSQSQTSSSSIPTVPSTSPLSQTVSDEISTSSMSIIEPSETFIFSTSSSSSSLDSSLESSNIIPTSVPASVLESTESIIQGFTTEPSISLESSPSQELTITFSLEPSISVEASSSEELAITLFSDFLSGESPLISTEPSISISFTEILTQESLLSGTYESLIMTTPPLTDMSSVSDSEQSQFLTIIETQEFSESLISQSSVSAESTLFMESSLSEISSLTLGETFGPSTGVADSTDITESSFQTFETIGVTTIEISPSILFSSPVSSEIFYSSMENSSASESISSQSSALIGSSTDDFFTSAATTDSMIMASSESEMSTSVLDTIPVTPSESSDFPTTSSAITEPPSTPPLTPVTDPPNRPPQILNPINKLVIKIGSYFRVQVPMDTFFDYEDGGTRNLKLNLTTIMGGPLGPSSFVQFDSVNQTLYGLALPQDLQPEPHKVLLRAEDSGGAIATDVIEIIINTSGLDDISFTLEAWFQLEYVNFIGDRENVVNLVKRIAVFYGDKPDYYTIASIQKGSVVFLWTDSRVSKDECQNNTIQSLYEAIYSDGGINGTFRQILLPEFPITHISLNLMHVCVYPEETTTVVYPTTAAAAVAGASTNLILAIVLPIIIILIIIAVALIIFCCLRKKHTSAYIPEDEKPIYSKNRKPVLLENELEMRDVHNQPRKPTVLDTDVPQGLFDNPAYLGPEDERRAPPPYAVPRAGGFGPDFDQAQSQSPPPLYFIDAPDGARPDLPKPPAYRLPPPYLSYPGSSDI